MSMVTKTNMIPADTILGYGVFAEGNTLFYYAGPCLQIFRITDKGLVSWSREFNETEWTRTNNVHLNFHLELVGMYSLIQTGMQFDSALDTVHPILKTRDEFGFPKTDTNYSQILSERMKEDLSYQTILSEWFSLFPNKYKEVLAREAHAGLLEYHLIQNLYRMDEFYQLMVSNPALAVCLTYSAKFRKNQMFSKKGTRLKNLLRLKQKELLYDFGFGDLSETIVKKIRGAALRPELIRRFQNWIHSASDEIIDLLRHLSFISDILIDYLISGSESISNLRVSFNFLHDIVTQFGLSESMHYLPKRTPGSVFTRFGYQIGHGLRSMHEEVNRYNPNWVMNSIHDLETYHDRMIQEINSQGVEEIANRNVRFIDPPFPGDQTIRPIRDLTELFLEGKSMHNCVFTYEKLVIKGETYFYHLNEPEDCSFCILQIATNIWDLGEVKAKYNAEPSEDALRKIYEWCEKHSILFVPPEEMAEEYGMAR